MVLGWAEMIVRTGPLTALTSQISRAMNMESMFAGRKACKLGSHFDAAANFFKSHISVNGAGVKHSYSENHLQYAWTHARAYFTWPQVPSAPELHSRHSPQQALGALGVLLRHPYHLSQVFKEALGHL